MELLVLAALAALAVLAGSEQAGPELELEQASDLHQVLALELLLVLNRGLRELMKKGKPITKSSITAQMRKRD